MNASANSLNHHANPYRYYKSREGYEAIMAWYDALLARLPPHESRYVETRFGATHLLALGPADGTPLVLIQGLAGSAVLWHQQLADFARVHRVYALDTVGQPGRSAQHAPSLLDDSYAHWLSDVLDALALSRAHMAGVSLGGWIILQAGITIPDRLHKSVLLSPMGLARARFHLQRWLPNPFKRRQNQQDLEDRLTVRSFQPEGGQEKFDVQLARAMALATKHYRVDLSLGLREDQSRLAKLNTSVRLAAHFLRPIPFKHLQRFQAPALLILGEHEVLYDPQRAARRAQRAINDLRVGIVPDAGHAAMYDRPAITNALILDYLAS